MDQAPRCGPARQVPLTTACAAARKSSAKGASAASCRLVSQVPEYSPVLPDAAARQPPVHPVGDFAADHPPRANVRFCASMSVHAPLTAPVAGSTLYVHVPMNLPPLLVVALHVFG
jgi:hypothetical protein